MSKQGVLLVNLGSPDSTSVKDVRKYLAEFLMDGRVMDAPLPIRFGIVHGCILPFRPKQSAEAYERIWTPEGSPLVLISKNVRRLLQERLDAPVGLAMRYQNPSIKAAVAELQARQVEELLLIPLFPHYAMSSFETAVERVKEVLRSDAPRMTLSVAAPYYAEPGFISALVENARAILDRGYDHLLFSFHGLPERHLKKSDPTRAHCLQAANCCETPSPAHATCYRAQCFQTVRAFAEKAGLRPGSYSTAFQSRLGRDPWLRPYTDFELERLAKSGVKRLLVMCPAFVSDCLETLEEIGMRGAESFKAAGGGELTLIPCLNEHPLWIDFLEELTRRFISPNSAIYEPRSGG